ncbi:hypothetical protein [Nocardia sp. NPDC057353]|uniref:hypothetical protein n=1 Tax=Nocardia sp. NPDC057353 TaxID=3346104 RepID=UPI00363A916A
MNLATLFTPAHTAGRFFLVGVLPTYCAGIFLLVLVWAGAPGPLRFTDAWATAANLGLGEALLITLAVSAVALLLHPFQLGLVRLLEGYHWPERLARPRHTRHATKLAALTQRSAPVPVGTVRSALEITAWQRADRLRRTRYPNAERVRPTALGNALAAAEYRAGREYGFEAVVAWPRLYPLLSDRVRVVVDDRRDQLDLAARFTALGGPLTVVTAALLYRSQGWLALAAVPLLVAILAYGAAVRAAVEYGVALRTAFDLHRFDLVSALHLELPGTPADERDMNRRLCAMWAQGGEAPAAYRHP